MDEIAADFTERLLTNEKDLRTFLESMTETKQKHNVMQKFFEAVRDFIEKVCKLFKSDKAKMDNAMLEEFGATVAELEKAERLWKDLIKATADKVKTSGTKKIEKRQGDNSKAQYSLSDKLTKNENDDMIDRKISYSIKDKKWHPDISKKKLMILMRIIKNDAATSINIITDKTNWILTRIEGEPVFAIYSTEDLISPTLLYEAKGEQGVFERDILLNLLEAYKNGESVDGKSRIINRVSSGGWMQQSSGVENINGALGRESSNRNAGVLQGQSKGKPSRAFESVIENIFEVQRGIETDTNNAINFSLKGQSDLLTEISIYKRLTRHYVRNLSLRRWLRLARSLWISLQKAY